MVAKYKRAKIGSKWAWIADVSDHGFDIYFVRADVNVFHNVADWCNTALNIM